MTEADFKVAMDADDYPDIRDTVRRICEEFPASYWRDLEDQPIDRRYPEEFVRILGEAGFLGPCVAETYGGVGLPMRVAAVIVETLHESGCNAAKCVAQIHLTELLARRGSEVQKQTYLPRIAEGEVRLQALAVSEPGIDTDFAAMTTSAEKRDGGYVITGRKNWVYAAASSNLMVLAARTTPVEEVEEPADGVSLFMINLDEAKGRGLEIELTETMNNDNGAEVVLSQCNVAGDCLIGEEGRAHAYLDDASGAECLLIAAAACGDAKFFVRRATDYANERVVFGSPIGKYQGIQFPLAKALVEAQGAELVLRKAIALYDAGRDANGAAHVARHLAVDSAWAMADAAFTTHGGFAFAREYDIERKWRDVRAARNVPIPTSMGLDHIGERVLGLPRSP